MKKSIISILVLLILVLTSVNVHAASTSELIEQTYAIGSKYGMTDSDKVKAERYLADNPVTEEEADELIAKAKEIDEIMKNAGVTEFSKLSKSDKDKVEAIANSAAKILKVNLTIKEGKVEIYKNGKLIETLSSNRKLAYTGNSAYIYYGGLAAVVVALAIVLVIRKKNTHV